MGLSEHRSWLKVTIEPFCEYKEDNVIGIILSCAPHHFKDTPELRALVRELQNEIKLTKLIGA